MRELTDAERELLETRRVEFPEFYAELMPVLVDFVNRLGIEPAHIVLTDAVGVVPLVGTVLQDMPVGSEDDRVWLLTRVGYLVGEYLVQKYGGCWFVNEDPESRTFARNVVGQFAALGESGARVDPFQVAQEYVDAPPGRDLVALLDDVERELLPAAGSAA